VLPDRKSFRARIACMTGKQARAKIEAVRKFLPAWDAYTTYVLCFANNTARKAKPDAAKFKTLFGAMRKRAKPLQERMADLPRWTRHGGPCLFVADTAFTTPASLRAGIEIDRVFARKDGSDPLNTLTRDMKGDAAEYANELRAILPIAKDKPELRQLHLTKLQEHVLLAVASGAGPLTAEGIAIAIDERRQQASANESSIRRAINGTSTIQSTRNAAFSFLFPVNRRTFTTASGFRGNPGLCPC
jgi:hypothetical protein